MNLPPSKSNYLTLLSKIQKTLLDSQRRIEVERVKMYWETGRIISADILKNKSRAQYGAEVVKRLAGDLKVNVRQLNYCIQFFKVYPQLPIMHGRAQFKWTHYRALLTIGDDQKRLRLERQTLKAGWTAEELQAKIQQGRPKASKKTLNPIETITPIKQGRLYTYANTTIAEIFAITGEIRVDCGFNLSRQIRPKDWPKAAFRSKMEYTYRAYVERVVDGDTLKVQIDLGLGCFIAQRLRLRGIDCPESTTLKGQKAKRFVQKLLEGVPTITIVTHKSDKYDRYLADVWAGDVYLNQRLLDERLASIWK